MRVSLGRLALLLCSFLLVEGSELWAQDSGHFGKAVRVKGEVKVTRRFKRKVIKAEDALLVKDKVTTGNDSSLEIQMGEKNNLFITANSKITLHHPTSDGKKKEVMIKLMAGTIRSKLDGLKETDTVFSIRSPTAVAGVRGTDFVTGYNPALGNQAFSLTVLEGSVEVSGIDQATQKATAGIQVKPAQRITVSDQGAVQDVVKVTPEEMNQLKEQFTVSTDEVKEEKREDKKDEKNEKEEKEKDKKEEQGKKDGAEDQEEKSDDQEKDEKADGEGEGSDGEKEKESSEGDQKEESDADSKEEGDTQESSSSTDENSAKEEGSSEREGDQKESTSSEGQKTETEEGAKTEDGSTGKTNDQESEPSGEQAPSQDSGDTSKTNEANEPGGEQQDVTSSPTDEASVPPEEGQAPSGQSTGDQPAALEVNTVGSTENGDGTDVKTDVDVEVQSQEPVVEVEPEIELDLNDIEAPTEEIINDQIQDQIDAINDEVSRTLRLIIRQGD